MRCRSGADLFVFLRPPPFRDGNQGVRTLTDVRIPGQELPADNDGAEFDFQASAERHPFASVTRQIDEQPLNTLQFPLVGSRALEMSQPGVERASSEARRFAATPGPASA